MEEIMDLVNMTNKALITTIFMILCACSGGSPGTGGKPAAAGALGTSNGGGGKGVQCGSSLMVLDLYEAGLRGKPLLRAYPTYDENVAVYGAAVGNFMNDPTGILITGDIVRQAMKEHFDPKIKYVPYGQRLPATQDASLPVLPANCQFVQIAIWEKNDEIKIDRELWERLPPQHQAALALHELIYLADRKNGANTSDESRFVIADIFTNPAPRARMGPFLSNTDRVMCFAGGGDSQTPKFEFFAYGEIRNSARGVGFYFRSVADNYMMALTEGFLANMRTEDLIGEQKFIAGTKISNVARAGFWNLEFQTYDSGNLLVRAWKDGASRPEYSNGYCYRD
jgi:hypothetical protein